MSELPIRRRFAGSARMRASGFTARRGGARAMTPSSSIPLPVWARTGGRGVAPARGPAGPRSAGCAALLSDSASFLLLNAYSERLTGLALAGLMADALADRGGVIDWGELALMEEGRDRGAGLSFFARWSAPNDPQGPITSLATRPVKAARGLHLRKERDESGLFLAEGRESSPGRWSSATPRAPSSYTAPPRSTIPCCAAPPPPPARPWK